MLKSMSVLVLGVTLWLAGALPVAALKLAPGCRIVGRVPGRVIISCHPVFNPEPNDPPSGTGGSSTR